MEFTTNIDHQDKTIVINASCLLTQDIRKNILSVVAVHLDNSSYDRVLVDLRNSSFNPAEPMTGALELAAYMASIGISSTVKIAFLFEEAERHRKYFEGVANTSGFNVKYFRNMDTAVAWLHQKR